MRPGAIAVLDLMGGGVEETLAGLTGYSNWRPGELRLVDLGGVDRGIAVLLDRRRAQIMPHGGPRVLQLLRDRLVELDAIPVAEADDPMVAYPEASNIVEALMLRAIARAQSDLAIDLLLDQPRRWRSDFGDESDASLRERAAILHRLLEPPLVVVAGPPNVGKSSLLNRLVGREASIAADEPGVTRDSVGAMIDLRGLTVRWFDTPGRRESDDEIEQAAIRLSTTLIDRADLLLVVTEPGGGPSDLADRADLRIGLKADLAGPGRSWPEPNDATLSVVTGDGIASLVDLVRERLVPRSALDHPGRWLFDERLLATPASGERKPSAL